MNHPHRYLFALFNLLLVLFQLSTTTAATVGTNCSVDFLDASITFTHCDLSSTPSFELYYTVSQDETTIDTLFRATTTGYVSFAWGYSSMVDTARSPFHTLVATSSYIKPYVMGGRTSETVTPDDKISGELSDLLTDLSTSNMIAARFTRNLKSDDLNEDEFPELVMGEDSTFIWAHGDVDSDVDVLQYHTEKGSGSTKIEALQLPDPSTPEDGSPMPSLEVDPTDPGVPTTEPDSDTAEVSVAATFESNNIEIDSSISPTPSPARSNTSCVVEFDNTDISFSSCELDLFKPLKLYYSVVNETTEDGLSTTLFVDTLFQTEVPSDSDPRYVSFGWGYDQMVVGDGSIVMLAYITDGTEVKLSPYILSGKSGSDVTRREVSDLINDGAELSNGMLSARFRQPFTGSQLPTLGLNSTSLIWAVGNYLVEDTEAYPNRHDSRGTGKVDLNSDGVNEARDTGSSLPRRRAHSVFMAVSWTVVAPAAVIIIRYFKKNNPTSFLLHITLNFTATVCTLIGLFLVVFQSNLGGRHQIIGLLVVALAIVQVIIGIIRPKLESGARRLWYFIHAVIGSVAVTLGYVNTFYGVGLDLLINKDRKYIYYTLIGISLAVNIILNVVFSFMPNRCPVTPHQLERYQNRNNLVRFNSEQVYERPS